MKFLRAGEEREFEVELLSQQGTVVRALIDGRQVEAGVEALPAGGAIVTLEGRRHHVFAARQRDSILVAVGPATYRLTPAEQGPRRPGRGLSSPEVAAPMPGKVLRILVADGEKVERGQPLAVIEAMKMETTLSAESPAIVKRVCVREGQMVDHGDVMIELSPAAGLPTSESAPAGA